MPTHECCVCGFQMLFTCLMSKIWQYNWWTQETLHVHVHNTGIEISSSATPTLAMQDCHCTVILWNQAFSLSKDGFRKLHVEWVPEINCNYTWGSVWCLCSPKMAIALMLIVSVSALKCTYNQKHHKQEEIRESETSRAYRHRMLVVQEPL